MRRDRLGLRHVAGKMCERRIEPMHRHEKLLWPTTADLEKQMQLVYRLQVRHFDEHGPIVDRMHASNRQRFMTDHTQMTWSELRRAVARAISIVPGLSEMSR